MGKSSVSCFFDSRCITVHETTNDSYESMQSGTHGAAIMLKTVCAVISNYSKLKNIENKSEDLIHCKMQWLGSPVVSMLDLGAESPASNRSRDTVG